MREDPVVRSNHAAARHDAALAQWPDRDSDEFRVELMSVVRDLRNLVTELPVMESSVDWARTFRRLGDALFDLAMAGDRGLLREGDAAYRRAEQLLGSADLAELGTLQVNWANTLRVLAGTQDRALAEAALQKYRLGRSLIASHKPAKLGVVEDLLGSYESMLSLWRLHRLAEARGVCVDTSEAAQLLAALASGDGADATVFNALRQRFEADVSAGKIEPARVGMLAPLIAAIQEIAGPVGGDLAAAAQRSTRARELMARVVELQARPSHGLPVPPSGSRAAAVLEHWMLAKRRVVALGSRSRSGATTHARALELSSEVAQLERELYVAGDDDAATRTLERDRLRSVTAEVRRFALLDNLTLAKPAFAPVNVYARADHLYFSGDPSLRAVVARACAMAGLKLQPEVFGDEYGQMRWLQLREAGLAFFAFTGASDATMRAAVAYEFGLARSLGLSVVVVCDQRVLPFDVAVTPVHLRGDSDDTARIAASLDAACYAIPPESAARHGIVATARACITRFGDDPTRAGLSGVLDEMAKGLEDPDAKAIEGLLRAALLEAAEPGLELIQPAWAPVYPEPGRARLFHVMPFRPSWAAKAAKAAAMACGTSVEYARHDHTEDDHIIESLWAEIGRATHVLVDITGMNENVAVELGFADALGKPALLVARKGTVDQGLFPAIARRRVHEYKGPTALTDLVARFLRIL